MLNNLISKHLWEGIFIGTVASMIVMAFFMPYYEMHYQISNEINEVIFTFSPSENPVSEIVLDNSELRLVVFEEIRDLAGTIFSPTLLFSNSNYQESTMFYSSLDYFMRNETDVGDTVEIMGLTGLYAGFYPTEHPYGDDFVVVISEQLEDLEYKGEMRDWNMSECYKTHPLPRGFRGVKLLNFFIFCGLLYFIYGLVGLLLDNSISYIKENFVRMSIVSLTIVIAVTCYGKLINSYNNSVILWSCGIAIFSNLVMLLPLFIVWLGKKNYKRV